MRFLFWIATLTESSLDVRDIADVNKTTYVGNELLLHDPAISDDAERLASFYSIVNNKAFLSHLEQIFLEHNRNHLSRSSSARLRGESCS